MLLTGNLYAACTIESYTRRKANNTVFLTREQGVVYLNCREFDVETGLQINIVKKEITIADLQNIRNYFQAMRENIILLITDIQTLP